MKAMVLIGFLFLSLAVSGPASAEDSGLKCSMAYSTPGPLATGAESTGGWLVAGGELAGSAVGADGADGWTQSPANYIRIAKTGEMWSVQVLDASKSKVKGRFSFPEQEGMKISIPTKAFAPGQDEDPPEYNTLEVSCSFADFVG